MDREKIILGFKEYLKSEKMTKSTITGYSFDVQNFFKWLDLSGKNQEENPKKNVSDFMDHLIETGINTRTINHHLYALKKFLDYIEKNKFTKVMKGSKFYRDKPLTTIALVDIEFSKADIDKFISEIKKTGNKRYYALVQLMAKAGLKISETLELKIENISGNKITIINEERELARTIKASKEVLSAIKDYLSDRKGESPYLFNSNKSENLDRTVVNRFFKEFNVTPKQLRQYFIIQCLENNKDMTDISKHAGIKSLQWLTSRYENIYYDPEKHNLEDPPEIKEIPAGELKAESILNTDKPKSKTILGVTIKEIYSPPVVPVVKAPETIPETVVKADKKLKIENWLNFEKDFNDFLFDYKMSNRTRPRLMTHGKVLREDMENHPEFKEAFRKICEKLPENILKNFRPMYRQGYFYLYENEIIEIASQETRDEILLLLYESLRNMTKDEPVKEAKKFLGMSQAELAVKGEGKEKKMKLETIEQKIIYYPFKGNETISAIYSYEKRNHNLIPLYLSSVSAGFPSPADDYIENKLDLNELLVQHPSATFFTRVNGNSMIEAGIFHNDLLVVDRSEPPSDGTVIIAVVDGELTVKRLKKEKGKVYLVAENPDYKTIEIKEDTQFEIWGVVIAVIHKP